MYFPKPKGFTLIELIIALAIMGILAAIAGVSLYNYKLNLNLKAAAGDIAADMANCKVKASSEGVRYRIVFNIGSNYSIQKGTESGEPFTTVLTKSPSTFGTDIRIISANFAGNTYVDFYTRGTVSPGSVQLTNSRNSTATVVVNMTGRTYVQTTLR